MTKGMKLRPYEERLVTDVVVDLAKPTKVLNEVVLAAAPGAGKTMMSISIIERLLAAKHARRILVLAHATTLLRDQYVNRLDAIAPPFSYAPYWPRSHREHVPFKQLISPVVVGLPQSLASVRDLGRFDVVVVDEAHLFYGEKMVTEIIERVGATRVLLLTGTPAPFVARGLKLHVVSMQELYREGKDAPGGPWIADAKIKLIESTYDVSRRQYNEDGEIRRSVALPGKRTMTTLDGLRSWLRSHTRSMGNWPVLLQRVGKTMIVLRSQKAAATALAYFKKAGVNAALSTSDTDAGSVEIGRFMRDASVQLLLVVCRANVGFDYPQLGALIDMTGTINIDRIFQMFARIVRPNGETKKLFVKLASADMFQYMKSIVKASLLLAGRAFYETWNGKNLNGVRVPNEPVNGVGTEASRKRKRRLPAIDDGFLAFEDFLETSTAEDGALIAGTTVGEAAEALGAMVVNPGQKKAELRAYYAEHGKPVPYGHRLYGRQVIYVTKSSHSFDPVLQEQVISLGYKTIDPDRRKSYVLAYYAEHGKPVPPGHSLYRAQGHYASPSSSSFDPVLLEEARAVGYKTMPRRNVNINSLIGTTFPGTDFIVLGEAGRNPRGKRMISVKCKCARTQEILLDALTRTAHQIACGSCSAKRRERLRAMRKEQRRSARSDALIR